MENMRIHLTNIGINIDKNKQMLTLDDGTPQIKLLSYFIDELANEPGIFEGELAQMGPAERKTRLWKEIDTTIQRIFLGLNGAILRKAASSMNISKVMHVYPPNNFGVFGVDLFPTKTGKFVLFDINSQTDLKTYFDEQAEERI